MIGKLSSTIKSRRYPEENLLNRYLRRIATIELGSDDAEEDADDDDEHNHPLIVPRSIIDRAHVSWPPRKSGADRASKDGLDRHKLLLADVIGDHVAATYADEFTMVDVLRNVTVGQWKYGFSAREDGRRTDKTRTSFFSILAADLPHAVANNPNEFDRDNNPRVNYIAPTVYYGRIERFCLLTLQPLFADQSPTELMVACVKLYSEQSHKSAHIPGIISVDTSEFLKYKRVDKDGASTFEFIRYVQAAHLQSCVATGQGLPHRIPDRSPGHPPPVIRAPFMCILPIKL